jgi:hypothetical protein
MLLEIVLRLSNLDIIYVARSPMVRPEHGLSLFPTCVITDIEKKTINRAGPWLGGPNELMVTHNIKKTKISYKGTQP